MPKASIIFYLENHENLCSIFFAEGNLHCAIDKPNPNWSIAQSSAQWIAAPGADPHAFGVYLFRKSISLSAKPAAFTVYVSADNRYQLFVNGKRVSVGPAKGDPAHWRYETVDLAPALQKGNNTIAALVWNEGEYLSWSQTTVQTGFFMIGISNGADIINTNPGWKVMQNKAYGPPNKEYIVSPFENVNAAELSLGLGAKQLQRQ